MHYKVCKYTHGSVSILKVMDSYLSKVYLSEVV